MRSSHASTRASFVRLTFEYAPDINYSKHFKIVIITMNKVNQYCQTLQFSEKTPSMCCKTEKFELLLFSASSESL